ncbi:hypothetical protein [Streptomyces zagrosensis]|uniref:Uncharacterized protein n=1 Tax=Streptomyces zagrosensis TaxID=1042984 RepID=A0A7W9Q9P6_9ACTN|nr:hypothetical protein [Streptomyces zagrosensis]MBB5935217.1 hypothetical protein [Streptomyces zagrosensis]
MVSDVPYLLGRSSRAVCAVSSATQSAALAWRGEQALRDPLGWPRKPQRGS